MDRTAALAVLALGLAACSTGPGSGSGSGSLGPTHRPVDPYAQPSNVPAGNASTAAFAAAHAPGPVVPVGRWVSVRCLAVPPADRGTFEVYALFATREGLLLDATPLARIDSPWAGWTARFPVPARAHLRDADESGVAPRIAMVHYARGDRNRISPLAWAGGAFEGAGSTFALSQESETR